LKIPPQRSAALEARSGRGREAGEEFWELMLDTELELMFRSRKPAGEEKMMRREKETGAEKRKETGM